ncbi:hypothetical protein KP509_03G016000 [Ceratopteris richardii]|uniref:BTB domain-containing protein n=1 Tax=Ceratopteris richardii TaxID=49495 RepID=A0A8T2V515_CERRI|nr:hypothetical protein KP509_03G016000 [Ceratopteris richardii]KAH7440915.1 hypothetical protein KP509_03G016000 [Ceratopteris richardii]
MKDALKSSEQATQTACKRSTYLNELVEAFRRSLYEDLELVTDDGLSLRTHGVILTSRSQVFRTMLELDSDTHEKCLRTQVPDIGHNELKLLIQFIYSGQITVEDLKDHALALLMAADKFNIALLKEICETYFLQTLTASNALDVLELAARLSSPELLEEAALSAIAKNYKLITLSNEYEEFAVKNPLLSVKVSRSIIDKI